MIELRRHVERIVRPIRASGLCKTRMREELLSHLAHLYEEELAKCVGDPPAAFAAAIERFGDPATLRAELQAAVPVVERWMFAELAASKWGRRRPGETMKAHLRRTVPWIAGVNAVVWILLVLFIAGVSRRRPERANEANLTGFIYFAIAYVVLFPIVVHGPVIICHLIRQEIQRMPDLSGAVRRRARFRVAGYTAANMGIFSGAMGLFMFLLDRAITFPLLTTFWFVAVVLSWAVAALPITAIQVAEMRRYEEWGSLDIEAAPGATLSSTDE